MGNPGEGGNEYQRCNPSWCPDPAPCLDQLPELEPAPVCPGPVRHDHLHRLGDKGFEVPGPHSRKPIRQPLPQKRPDRLGHVVTVVVQLVECRHSRGTLAAHQVLARLPWPERLLG